QAGQHAVLDLDHGRQAGPQVLGVEQLAQAYAAAPARLVLVAGADAPAGGADRAGRRFGQLFLFLVVREDDVGVVADEQVRAHGDAVGLGAFYFREEAGGVDDDAVGDEGAHVRLEPAGGQQGELVGLAVPDDGVAGVGPAVVADDEVMLIGEQIDDFPFRL